MFSFAKLLRSCFAAVLLGFFCAGMAQAQKYVKLALFPDASEELYGISSGGKLYVFGGLGPDWTPKGLVYDYDPATDKWTKRKNMPLLSHHVALAELNGKIYVIGGFVKPQSGPSAWTPIDNAWEYDPANDSWKPLAPLPTKRGSPNAAVVNGKIYVIGGAGLNPGSKETSVHPARPQRVMGTNEVYDPATNTWQTRSPMPTTRNHAAVGVVNNKIYVIGGRVGNAFITRASNTDVVEEYDPATDQWGDLKASMPTARSATAWGTYKGKIYVAGGEVRTDRMAGTFRAVEAYDPATNKWLTLPPMEFARHGLAGDVVGNRLHLVSGNVQSGGGPGMVIATDYHEALILDPDAK
jgi:N-acetylneuraminic acid mutarotase